MRANIWPLSHNNKIPTVVGILKCDTIFCMKIISLNTWGGYAGREKLLPFFDKYKNDVDIFCLQEVWNAKYEEFHGTLAGGKPLETNKTMTNGRNDIQDILKNHMGYFRPHFMDDYGLFLLINKKYKVVAEGEVFVYKEKGYISDGDVGNHARNIQYVTFELKNKLVTVINFHGLWNGKGKTDTEDRLNQSRNIINFVNSLNSECILCGDFNLLPSTKSLQMFEEVGLENLIKKYNIQSTRTSFYKKPEKFADYVFLSKGVKEKDFKVLPDEVSDHAPLFVEVE